MKEQPIAAELEASFKKMPSFTVDARWKLAIQRFLMNRIKLPYDASGVNESTVSDGTLRHQLYQPQDKKSDGVVLWIHGGGLIFGHCRTYDVDCTRIVRDLGVSVLSVHYRLAPEHPAPAALDDCHSAWQWLQGHADTLGIDPARIVVAGTSAGGGLAASLAQRLRDEGGVQPVGQVLMYPMLDDRTALNEAAYQQKYRMWTNRANRYAWQAYLRQSADADQVIPYAVAGRCNDLAGLPPAWLGVGDVDLFYDENKTYAQRLEQAGVSCEWLEIPDAPHAFDILAPDSPQGRAFIEGYLAFIRRMLAL